jgi:hypothetical protein
MSSVSKLTDANLNEFGEDLLNKRITSSQSLIKIEIYLLPTPKHTYVYGLSGAKINSNILGSNGIDIDTV